MLCEGLGVGLTEGGKCLVAGGWRGGIHFVHGRSRMTMDPRIPSMPGRSTSGFHPPGRHCLNHCLNQARSAVRCSASCMKGELHPSKNRSNDGLVDLVPIFVLMDDSANELLCFLVWPLGRGVWGGFFVRGGGHVFFGV